MMGDAELELNCDLHAALKWYLQHSCITKTLNTERIYEDVSSADLQAAHLASFISTILTAICAET
jgi:hypothetical protein